MFHLPQHLAIIMDGNGRWAQARGHNRIFGHVRGAKAAKRIIEECARLKVPYLTLFTFSTENWERPRDEVSFLMTLLTRRLRRERANLIKNNIRFRCIGDLSKLPDSVRAEVEKTIEATKHGQGMTLVFALSYGGRQELVSAMQALAKKVKAGELLPEDINEQTLRSAMESRFLPDPDLIIRTSGESRISNFFLWQSAYSEIYISPKMWPEFKEDDLREALVAFSRRERRFGKVSGQLEEPQPATASAQEGF